MRLKRENKGFSLVELIVVIAIFSVVGVVIGGFLLAANRSYAVSANELDIQEEAQLVANQMQEMILDTSLGISYQYVVTDDAGTELINYMENDAATLPAGTLSQKDLYIYGRDYYYHIYWDKENAQLYLVEYEKTASGYQPAEGMPATGVLFGEYVSNFSVDLSHVASDRMVSFDITFKKKNSDRDYLVSRNVSLRNDVLTNKPKEEVYNAVGIEFEPVADSMSISPASGSLWPGESLKFTVTLMCSKGGVPSQDVSWAYFSGDGVTLDSGTRVTAGGTLQIGSNEESSLLNLTASTNGYDYNNNVSKVLSQNIPMYIKQIRSLTIVSNDFETNPVSPGGTYKVKVKMDGVNISGESITSAGGIVATVNVGNEYASITNMEVDGLQATFTVKLADDKSIQGKEIALSFKPARAEFSDIVASTGVYKIGGSDTSLFNISSSSGTEWLRLGYAKTNIEFASDSLKETYCNDDGSLKDGYYVRYTYQMYDSNYSLKATAYKSTNNNGNVYTSYFSSVGTMTSESMSTMLMTDKVFLTSGMVVVKAELMHNTSGSAVVVGSSDNLSYFIPEATIGFRRAINDTASSSMKAYITSSVKSVPIYITFSQGFANQNYSISVWQASCTPAELGGISSTASDVANKKIVVVGSDEAEYKTSAGNVMTFTYGDLTNSASIYLVSPNVSGTNYYVPVSSSEWTVAGSSSDGTKTTSYYTYYIDDTHKMDITYIDGVFSSATFNVLTNLQWTAQGNYTINRNNKTWELTTP